MMLVPFLENMESPVVHKGKEDYWNSTEKNSS